ncbi:hypothetical protein BDP55DRAFT_121597 [Colletotrichum godetiae]|uniref:Uncharacterized protein n=1 Tax=Colletotrichum godetiae TaxID=1209918 RepID=A0AAJ0AXP2_9PEZI|nr:uncharacterized protein BDP55DRAFT_121597 [Colletotrichum godetiae]KAK1700202.1 hypothetical protein BDP55DRAFT_121597 [Colletotrichum godetiae]
MPHPSPKAICRKAILRDGRHPTPIMRVRRGSGRFKWHVLACLAIVVGGRASGIDPSAVCRLHKSFPGGERFQGAFSLAKLQNFRSGSMDDWMLDVDTFRRCPAKPHVLMLHMRLVSEAPLNPYEICTKKTKFSAMSQAMGSTQKSGERGTGAESVTLLLGPRVCAYRRVVLCFWKGQSKNGSRRTHHSPLPLSNLFQTSFPPS